MALPTEAIKEFQQIWLIQYGRPIDEKVAEKVAIKLLNMVRAIYKTVPRTDAKILEKYEKTK